MEATFDRFKDLARIIREKAANSVKSAYGVTFAETTGDGANDDIIREAERRLGVRFPNSYKWFLEEFGYVNWPDEIKGLVQGCVPGEADDIVNYTELGRHTQLEPIHVPLSLIPFAGDGFFNQFCMDTSRLIDGECPVVFWNHELDQNQVPKRLCDNFLDWLQKSIEMEQELDDEDDFDGA